MKGGGGDSPVPTPQTDGGRYVHGIPPPLHLMLKQTRTSMVFSPATAGICEPAAANGQFHHPIHTDTNTDRNRWTLLQIGLKTLPVTRSRLTTSRGPWAFDRLSGNHQLRLQNANHRQEPR